MGAARESSKIGMAILVTGAALVVAFASTLVFFGETVSFWLNGGVNQQTHAVSRGEDEILSIAYAAAPSDLSPVRLDPVTRSYLVQVYEGLVRTDKNLVIEPALALSWGRIDDYTWEFRLRPDALFHNGKRLAPEDVKDSLEYARGSESSGLKSLLSTIVAVETVGSDRVRVITKAADPLLLNKLALAFIFPEGYRGFFEPVGTGPYAFVKRVAGDVTLKRFDGYWGRKPAFKNVVLRALEDRRERTAALENGDVQLLAHLPPNVGCSFRPDFRDAEGCLAMNTSNIQVQSLPNLEVSFLVFNVEDAFLGDINVRRALARIIDREVFVELVYGFARPATQLISGGSFGYDPSIGTLPYSVSFARQELAAHMGHGFDRVSITFDYPQALPGIGQYVRDQFSQVGIDIVVNPLSDYDLQQKILNGTSQMYYLGWHSDMADALSVVQSVVHTKDASRGYGAFNGGGYSNPLVDALIEKALQNLDNESRLAQIQEVMRIAVQDDVMALPLFEPETIVAFSLDITFTPRMDGYIYASEIY